MGVCQFQVFNLHLTILYNTLISGYNYFGNDTNERSINSVNITVSNKGSSVVLPSNCLEYSESSEYSFIAQDNLSPLPGFPSEIPLENIQSTTIVERKVESISIDNEFEFFPSYGNVRPRK